MTTKICMETVDGKDIKFEVEGDIPSLAAMFGSVLLQDSNLRQAILAGLLMSETYRKGETNEGRLN